jgi:hypothetical protein
MIKTLFSLLIITLSFQCAAAQLALCADENNKYVLSWAADGARATSGCELRTTNSRADGALWLSVMADVPGDDLPIVVEGYQENHSFKPTSAKTVSRGHSLAVSSEEGVTDMMNSVSSNFFTFSKVAFGAEERVTFSQRNNQLFVECHAGEKAAGLLFDIPKYLLNPQSDYQISVKGSGSMPLVAALIDRGQDIQPEHAAVIMGIAKSAERQQFDVQVTFDVRQLVAMTAPQLALLCPQGDSQFQFKRIMLETTPSKDEISASWIWAAKQWQTSPRALIDWAKERQLNRLYLQLQISDNQLQAQPQLRQLMTLAKAEGIALYIVEGDPAMVSSDGLANALRRAAVIKAFCTPGESDCFAGVQYDIEPYILSEYAYQRGLIWQRWSQAIAELHRFWQQPIEVAVPFWMIASRDGKKAIEAVKPAVSNYAVMAYRTSAPEIESISRPWLIWGDKNDKGIIIALENGILSDEIHQTYLPSTTAEGILEKINFDSVDVVILNKTPVKGRRGVNQLYDYRNQVLIPATNISFMGDEAGLFEQKKRLNFNRHRSFKGFAMHGLNQLSPIGIDNAVQK